MKKIISLIMALIMCAILLASCDDGPTGRLIKYDDDKIGLHYELPDSFKPYAYGEAGTYKTYINGSSKAQSTAYVVISYFTYSELAGNPALGSDPTLEELIIESVGSDAVTDGAIGITYNEDKTRATYILGLVDEGVCSHGTLIKGEGGIYLVQMFCLELVYDSFKAQFERWSNQIYEC